MKGKFKIAIADDNLFLIQSLVEKMSFFDDLEVCYYALNGQELIGKFDEHAMVDLVLMDLEMPLMTGIEATAILKNKYPELKILVLTVFDDDATIFKAIKAGADGYLLKEVEAHELHHGIVETLNGGAAMTSLIAFKTLNLLRNPITFLPEKQQDQIRLSQREIGVLNELSKGLSHTVIAKNLFLSPGTVRKHIENIYKKLQVHSKIEAVQKAKDNNWI